ncbi:Imm74 family immunity protein [Massilia soli]|uniref:Uncharacterized protein n=1 Tax=Massilia soli TaxID=2792854 RepID=A0ABS7SVE6_9BURK|nr:Imm74 family immunity protein [Massilia soli]MBZ2209932.1 hypothetical protein [Massilia soli]
MISITKATPSSITVLVDNKTVKVSGESFLRGHGSPDFIIDIGSIKKWDAPFDMVAITESERAVIVDYLLKELTARQWYVTAE